MRKIYMSMIYSLSACLMMLFLCIGNAAAQITQPQDQQCLVVHNSTDTDGDFVRDMIHRQQMAVDLSQRELVQGKNSAARAMAQKILDAQTKEISKMEVWLKNR